ncbi:MAG TPA: translation initiation factor [Candidatus Hydrogenedentes bacterium]|nr:translation initiation factor [Candidatus Hydrogenedentota bacterium]HOS03765.1 translation initiation factor [Candidatus Hydrogenedentota bacterium]
MPKRRIDTNPDRQPLSANPFASLEGLAKEGLPQGEEPAAPKACAPYAVARTRKGGMPVSLENRPGGKVVTVVGNVSGDAAALLKLLKHRCGAGGAVRGEVIEIQGDHRDRITTLLRDALR